MSAVNPRQEEQELAVASLRQRIEAAEAIGDSLGLAGGDHPPSWMALYREQLRFIRLGFDDLAGSLGMREVGYVQAD